ncbi:DENN (AEX-3) domain-containing protein [Phthorimaea operculella]|nr:DENN (AEX-3) domain-containing protein [Phthorimaea operculella]
MGSRLRDTVRYLFELFCEVAPGDHTREPYIIRKYPESYKNEEELKNVPKFAFPCQFENVFVQHYSFVLTSVDSKYTFCFCRYDPKANTALVLLSHLPWHDQFYKLLNCIANLINSPEKGELSSLLEACRIRPPMPGHTLKVTYNAGQGVFSCTSPDNKLPSIPENCNLTEYFSAMDAKCMAGLWAALLHERRVAIVASKPSRLSACVQAANATLFPMSWQHIFIPILPKHLVDYLLAPMPFLIGVPRTVFETVRTSEIGDVVILDVDANELRTPFNDLESLPPDMVASLKKALSDKNALGDAVSRAFLRALVCLIGGYRDVIRIEKGQLITFNAEAFVRTRKNMQPFLRKILQSQIFQQFIDERLDLLNSGRGFNDEFEVECNLYAEKLGTGSGQRLKQQYRDWAKTVRKEGGAFFKTVKDKWLYGVVYKPSCGLVSMVECNLYAEKLGTGSGQRLKQQYRDWAKTVRKEGGAFFKTVKDKVTNMALVVLYAILRFSFDGGVQLYAEKLGTGSGQRLKQQYRDWAKTVRKEGGAFFKTVKDKVALKRHLSSTISLIVYSPVA